MPEFRMPSLGADMDAGTLVEWLVKPGDAVHRGDIIAVVDTDKAAVEVECFDDGVIDSLLVDAGRKVPVGTVLAAIVPVGAAAPSVAAQPVPAGLVTSPLVRHAAEVGGVDLATVDGSGAGHVIHRADVVHAVAAKGTAKGTANGRATGTPHRASPMARRLAAQAGLQLTDVTGTGPDGAVRAEDVQRALTIGSAVAAPAAEHAAVRHGADRAEAMRHSIAALMDRSNREIPHYYLTTTIDMSAATDWLHARNRDLSVANRLVPAALLLSATARAAVAVPALNGTWVDDRFHPASTVDLGIVVSLRAGGIMVPVIADAAGLRAEQIMSAMRDLVTRTRSGRLRSSELSAPSITVTNLGDQGVDSVLGVIYPPQVALVGFGAVLARPWAVAGLLGVRPVVTASLAADHRASDGAVGARLLNHIDQLLQHPEEL